MHTPNSYLINICTKITPLVSFHFGSKNFYLFIKICLWISFQKYRMASNQILKGIYVNYLDLCKLFYVKVNVLLKIDMITVPLSDTKIPILSPSFIIRYRGFSNGADVKNCHYAKVLHMIHGILEQMKSYICKFCKKLTTWKMRFSYWPRNGWYFSRKYRSMKA